MLHGARICPRCRTRVDERRARGSMLCLSCGAQLGAPPDSSRTQGGGGRPARGKSSPLPWILGGVAALLVLGALGAVALFAMARAAGSIGLGDERGEVAPVSDAETTPHLELPVAAASGDAGKKLPTTTSRGATPTPSARPVVVSPGPTPTFGTPPPPVSVATPPPPVADAGTIDPVFPRVRALAELDRVTATLPTCKRTGSDPNGAGTIRVDFEPDGRVGTVSRKPFAGTSTGSCISARFLAIRLGRFQGTTQRFERSFTIAP